MAGAVQLAAEHEAGLLQQQVGVAAPVCSLQAGLCLFQEELEAKGSVRGLGLQDQPSCPPLPPSPPRGACLGIGGAFQLEEQFGDLAESSGRAQIVPKCAAQGSHQQVAFHGLQRLEAGKTHSTTRDSALVLLTLCLHSPSSVTLSISL